MTEPYTNIRNKMWDGLARLNVSRNAYMVLCAIIRNTICFHKNKQLLSNGFLAKATGLSERSVIRAIRELEGREIVTIVTQSCGPHPRLIQLHPDKITLNPDKTDTLQNAQGNPDKTDRVNPDKTDRVNPDKTDTQENKDKNKELKEREKKTSSFSETEDDDAAYYESIKRKVY